ncbi:hypothetical protein, partial [Microbacterium sp.]|uniref:hypothetical protein n=1 Tax=Microbacterium sp. TaxID=51671 RepID=UPI003C1B8808
MESPAISAIMSGNLHAHLTARSLVWPENGSGEQVLDLVTSIQGDHLSGDVTRAPIQARRISFRNSSNQNTAEAIARQAAHCHGAREA